MEQQFFVSGLSHCIFCKINLYDLPETQAKKSFASRYLLVQS